MKHSLPIRLGLTAAAGLWLLAGGLGAQPRKAPEPQGTTAAAQPSQAPVVFEGKTLFFVKERVLSFAPEDRARAIGERITRLAKDRTFSVNQIQVHEGESSSDLVAGDLVIMSVTDRDAAAAGRPRAELATEYVAIIRAAVEAEQQAYSFRTILAGALYTLLATVVLLLALRLMNFAFPRFYTLLERWRGTVIRSVRIQRLELFSADRITDLLIAAARAARLVAVVALLYFYIPLVLSFFPWTRGYAATILDYVMQPLRTMWAAFAAFLPNAFFIAVVAVVTFYAIKFVGFLFREAGRGTLALPGFHAEWAEPTYKIVRFLMIVFAAIVVFPYLPGSDSPAFQGISLFVGVLFSLGSTSAISNIVAGVLLTYTRAFQVGDRVKIGDTVGDVVEKTLLVTRVRTIKNVDIAVPNSLVLSSHIVNFSSSAAEPGLILHTSVTIGYDAPWRTVHQLLIDAALATEGILKEPAPFVLQTSLDDFYVSYQINAFTDQPAAMARTYSLLHQNIQDKFNEGGVEIMSPHYGALRDGNATTIPADHWPKNYQPPAFRVSASDAFSSGPGGMRGSEE